MRRLAFELETLARVVLVYRPGGALMNKYFNDLELSLRSEYGSHSVIVSSARVVAASLQACLVDGEQPRGPSWHWPNGTMTLAPVLDDDQR